ncbi:MAG TPA: hypothetical protein VNA87_07185 [Actinomycetota bacterium]|nr:hypothetical protein [Actinomycetota bacterium]
MDVLQVKSVSRFAAILIAVAVFTALVVANLSGSGQEVNATHTPANKAVASGKYLQKVEAGTAVELMRATLRTSKPTDLLMSVTLECAILTKLHNAGLTTKDATSSASASAKIDVWIQDLSGNKVPISSIGSASQNGSNTHLGDAVTFCQREEARRIADAEDPKDGIDEVTSYQDAKNANAFNWILLNAGSGVRTFQVMATLTESATCTKDLTTKESCSAAYIGNRTFIIQPEKFANDATVN